jgi:hypothetical protein
MDTLRESMDTLGEPMDTLGESMDTLGEPMDTLEEPMDTLEEPMETLFQFPLNRNSAKPSKPLAGTPNSKAAVLALRLGLSSNARSA